MVNMLDRKLLRDLWQLRAQVLAVALVVASGIVGYVGSLSAYDTLKNLQTSHYERARFAHLFAVGKRAPASEVDKLLRIPGVTEVEATLRFDVQLDPPGVVEALTGRIIALPEQGLPRINRLALRRGAWIDAPDSNQALVNEAFASVHGVVPGDRIGALLNGKRESLQIVGVVMSPEYIFPSRGGFGDERSFGIFWVGRERLAAAFNMEGAFNSLDVRLEHGASESAVVAELDQRLGRYGFTGAYGRGDQPSHRMLTQEIAQWKVYGTTLPVIVLGVAMFLLNVALTRQIGTQRGQIAALKAMGCDDGQLGRHYLKFALVIVLIAAPVGIAGGAYFGHAVAEMYARFLRIPDFEYRMLPWIPLSAVALSLAASALAVLGALLRVVRLPPAAAMRPPAPLSFGPTLGERLGLGRLVSPSVRMIVRDIERRPLRALLTTFGIASAVGVMIAGTWWGDSVAYLLDVEIRMRDRQDVSVALTEPVSIATIYDFANMPGVLRAEATRDAPVRLSNGLRSYRTTVSGLAADSQMRPLLDERLQRAPIPASGIVLNQRLAERLGLALGDTVHLEVLQGARARADLPVRAFSFELTQLVAHMDRDALNRLLGEGEAMSGARLLIDASRRDTVLDQLKHTPRVAAAMEIGPVIRYVREHTARNVLFFSYVLAVLGGAIALGVVYNNARIALAERAWDLASLRVLGATRGEVSALLLGELGAEVLIALPLGCLMGYGLAWSILALSAVTEIQLPLRVEPPTYAFACLVVLFAGVVSALIVRRRVDQLDLVSVLKTRE